jgi:hypothetical protein
VSTELNVYVQSYRGGPAGKMSAGYTMSRSAVAVRESWPREVGSSLPSTSAAKQWYKLAQLKESLATRRSLHRFKG